MYDEIVKYKINKILYYYTLCGVAYLYIIPGDVEIESGVPIPV